MVYYSYLAPADQLELTITVTPTVGNPNLYINTGAALASTELPVLTLLADGSSSCAACERTAVSPGDDALSFTLASYRRALQIGVFGETASEYKLVLSTADTIVPLTAGESKRFSSRAGGYRYFSATVPQGQAIDITVTPLTGDPDLFVSASAERPDSTSPECSSTPSWCSSVAGSRYEHVQVSAAMASGSVCPSGAAACTYHIGVHAMTAATYTVVAAWPLAVSIRLVDGLPQAALIEAAGVSRYYKTRVAGTHTDLSILLAPSYGSVRMYVQTRTVASALSYTWSTSGSSARLLIRHDDERFCADCDYFITVVAAAGTGTAYTLSATSSHGTTVLESGAPCSEVVNMGQYEYFKIYVTVPLVEVQVIMSTLSGNPDLYVSLTNPYPNATDYHLKSTDAEGDLITLTTVDMTLGSGSVLRSKDAQLEACVSTDATSATAFDTSCVLYVAVYGALGASTFTLTATVRELSAGFHVDAPTAIVADYASSPATFGPRMGNPTAISGAVVYATPGTACPPPGSTGDWRLTNAAEAAGAIVLLDRGPSDDTACPYPGRYFASKVLQAQRAGALAVIVANDAASAARTSPDALVNMGAVAGDQSALITIPSVFVSLATGELLKRQLSSGVRATFATPSDRLPILVQGLPQVGATDENSMRYYEVFVGPALHDRLTISVAPRFGNPDLFVTTSHSGRLPTRDSSDWSSEADGADSLVIDGGDAKACRNCLYYVGVLGGVDSTGGRASTSFTITASVASDARTLQSNVPATGQEVAIEEYLYYRFYVDRPGQGVTVGLTLDSGDADLYVSFAEERPTKLQSQFSAAGRLTCQNIDCGNSIEDGDAVHISAQQALERCPVPPCLAYVGVYGAVASTFNLLVTVSDASQETPVQLLDGAEQSARLVNAGDYAYFYFSVGLYSQSFDVNVVSTQGDPDLYIDTSRNGSRSYPDREHFLHRSTSEAGESLTVRTDAPGGCSGCDYRFAVYAWKASTFFSIAVTAQGGVRKLRDGSPASLRVQAGEVKYLGYRLLTATKLDVIVTPWSGNPSLFVQFGYKPFNPEGRTEAAAQVAPFSSTEPAGVEVVTLSPGPSGTSYQTLASSVPCWVYVAIRADGGANASCSVLVQQRASAPATLVDGQPQAGLVGRSGMRLYSVVVADMSAGLTITLTPDYGAPKLYLSSDAAGRTPPTRSSYRAAADADSLQPYTIHVDPVPATTTGGGGGGGGGGVYLLGVDGQDHPANFSLVARSGRSIEVLRDHMQTLSTIAPGETYYYSVDVPAGAARPILYVAPLQASARVALLDHVVRVDEWSTSAVQAALTHQVTVTPALPLALPLTPGGRNMVAVSNGAAAGGGGIAMEVALTPLLTPGEDELVLGDGKPQYYQAAAGERVLFVYVPGAGPYSISAVELDQPPDAALEMYVGQRRHPEAAVRLWDYAAVGLCSYDGNCVAQAEAGEVVQASLGGALEDACDGDDAACRIYITLVPSAAANLTVTASAAGRLTRLPLGRSHAVSDVVAAGAYKDFALKLQPGDAADDELEVRLQLCSGSASLYAGDQPRPRADVPPPYVAEKAPLVLPLQRKDLQGKDSYWVSVHGGAVSTARFELLAATWRAPPTTASLTGDAGRLALGGGDGRLTLAFEQLRLPCPLHVDGGARCQRATPPIFADAARVTYLVYVARRLAATVLGTPCGIKEADAHGNAYLLYNSSAPRMPTDAFAELKLDAGSGRGQVSVGLRGEWFDPRSNCSAADRRSKQQCAATLVAGEPYLVTLVARAPLGAVKRYGGGGEAYRAVYTAAQWQASRGGGGGGGGGGLSGGGVVLLLLGLGLAAGGAFYGRLVYTGKRSLRHDWAAASERGAILAAATVDKARDIADDAPGFFRGLKEGGLRAARGGGLSSTRRVRVGEDAMGSPLTMSSPSSMGTMSAPLTSLAYMPPAQEIPLPPLDPSRMGLATTPDDAPTTEPLQFSLQIDPAASATALPPAQGGSSAIVPTE